MDHDDDHPMNHFESMMGGFPGGLGSLFGFGGGGPRRRRREEDLVHPLPVTLVDLYNGKTSKLKITKSVICVHCKGQGGKPGAMHSCKTCRGSGVKIVHKQIGPGMVQQMQSVCPDCRGAGEMINEKDRCKTCQGKKVTPEVKVIEVQVQKGMKEGQKIVLNGEGNQAPGMETSDVIIVLQLQPHETFKRTGNDLFMTHTISLYEALCGTKVVIQHLDGRNLVIRNEPETVIEPNSVRSVAGEGMPFIKNPAQKGNLYIKFSIEFPEKNFITEPQLKALEALLPSRPEFEMPEGEHVEEVNMMELDESSASGNHDGTEDDGDGDGHPGMSRMQCAQQ